MSAWERAEALRLQVVRAAGGQCSCGGECGRRHLSETPEGQRAVLGDVRRCPARDGVAAPLHAAPVVLGLPEVLSAGMPAGALRALCDGCHGRLLCRAAKAAAGGWQPEAEVMLFR